ncbi:hypothetical protein G7Y89_g9785 [Cudoniella acicularis]|uniref:Uncharacterized protein n=1 Tax=Cudoniella acicularis TaxID=354080 RepID=A0A8H4RFJ5_9HELO|nr:hypothetical protein G7Y89_g9785 [Cudoniella acicularis]
MIGLARQLPSEIEAQRLNWNEELSPHNLRCCACAPRPPLLGRLDDMSTQKLGLKRYADSRSFGNPPSPVSRWRLSPLRQRVSTSWLTQAEEAIGLHTKPSDSHNPPPHVEDTQTDSSGGDGYGAETVRLADDFAPRLALVHKNEWDATHFVEWAGTQSVINSEYLQGQRSEAKDRKVNLRWGLDDVGTKRTYRADFIIGENLPVDILIGTEFMAKVKKDNGFGDMKGQASRQPSSPEPLTLSAPIPHLIRRAADSQATPKPRMIDPRSYTRRLIVVVHQCLLVTLGRLILGHALRVFFQSLLECIHLAIHATTTLAILPVFVLFILLVPMGEDSAGGDRCSRLRMLYEDLFVRESISEV